MASRRDKFIGCILGGMCGDVLGAAVEGMRSEQIMAKYPEGLTSFERDGARAYGCYTDDSQMTLALMKSLVKMKGECNPWDCAITYAQDFQVHRGYGATVISILADMKAGFVKPEGLYALSRKYISEGSYANGGAMRIAPVGLLYANHNDDLVLNAVKNALKCTHTHEHGIEGAYIMAQAIGFLSRVEDPKQDFDVDQFLGYLHSKARVAEMRTKINQVKAHMRVRSRCIGSWKAYYTDSDWLHELTLRYILGERFQIKALDAVTCALLAFCTHWMYPIDAVVSAVSYGGDTDTVGAMTGNLAFALWGYRGMPKDWIHNLEGRDDAIRLACELYDMHEEIRKYVS